MSEKTWTDIFAKINGGINSTRFITFQVTNDCCCNCSYCYQINKQKQYMTKDIAKECVDLLFKMYDEDIPNAFINHSTKNIILDFIGGEPLMNIEIIEFVCTYFLNKCLDLNHPWLKYWKASLISNGAFYFDPRVQKFLKKFKNFLSLSITLDGPKEIHDKCRKYYDGKGNFDDAYKAFLDIKNKFNQKGTKITIAPENLTNIYDITQFFLNNNADSIYANCIYEHNWTESEGSIYYQQLKKIADLLLQQDNRIFFSIFSDFYGEQLPLSEINCWCGATSNMLSFDPQGNIYPCIRFMDSSLGKEQKPYIIGDIKHGIDINKTIALKNITRLTKCSEECINCPVSSGCPDCSAWNYQQSGKLNYKSMNICNITKAGSLANVYYWNQLRKKYKNNNKDINFKKVKLNLPKQEALKFIDENEYNMLYELQKEEE